MIDKIHDIIKKHNRVAGGIGISTIFFLTIGLVCSVRILTVPVIMKNMLTMINTGFFFLGIGVLLMGSYVASHSNEVEGVEWISKLILSIGVLIIALSTIGLYGANKRSRSALQVSVLSEGWVFLR